LFVFVERRWVGSTIDVSEGSKDCCPCARAAFLQPVRETIHRNVGPALSVRHPGRKGETKEGKSITSRRKESERKKDLWNAGVEILTI